LEGEIIHGLAVAGTHDTYVSRHDQKMSTACGITDECARTARA
jgi:hypothetical protein